MEEGSTVPLRPALRSTAFGGGLSCAGPCDPLHVGGLVGQQPTALDWPALRGVWGLGGRIIPGGVGLIEVALVCQGDEAAVSDHYVVDDGDSDGTADCGELLRDGAIFG